MIAYTTRKKINATPPSRVMRESKFIVQVVEFGECVSLPRFRCSKNVCNDTIMTAANMKNMAMSSLAEKRNGSLGHDELLVSILIVFFSSKSENVVIIPLKHSHVPLKPLRRHHRSSSSSSSRKCQFQWPKARG